MTATRITFEERHSGGWVALGAVRAIVGHSGQDHEKQIDIVFEHGRMSMGSDRFRDLIRHGAVALLDQQLAERSTPAGCRVKGGE